MRRTAILLALAVFLLVAGSALAMVSTNYQLDWYVLLTNGGGGPANSASYHANFTVGQTAVGASTSTNYRGCLGFWCARFFREVYLPTIMRNAS
jgi:hypothetical protein